MKTLKSISLFLLLFSSNAMVGTDTAIESYLSGEFSSVRSVSEIFYSEPSNNCDELLDIYVVADAGSGETAYTCSICLVNDGGVAVADSYESFCSRD